MDHTALDTTWRRPRRTGRFRTFRERTALQAAALLLVLFPGANARADACDALAVRLTRATGAAVAGRSGPLVVFRTADAERMSLTCGRPRVVLLRAARREPLRPYFILIGMAGQALAGAPADAVENAAMNLHQATLLTGRPQSTRIGALAMRCEAGDRFDGFNETALCRIVQAEPRRAHRRRGLSGKGRPG